MGKVRDLVEEWQRSFREATRNGTYRSMAPGAAHSVDVAEKEDASAHAAELEAKDKRIAELETMLKGAQEAAIEWKQKCFDSRDAITRIGDAVGRHPGSHGTVEMAVRSKLAELKAELEAKTFRVSELTNDWQDRVRRNEELLSILRHIGDIVGRDPSSHEPVANAVLLKVTSLEAANKLLKAELAKRKELPPLPESVREWAENVRSLVDKLPWLRDLINWLDANCPAPVPQWERDAEACENLARGFNDGTPMRDVAARIREMGRELERAKSK